MSLKIYGIPRSRTFRALWVAEELNLPYENIAVNFTEDVLAPEKRDEKLAAEAEAKLPRPLAVLDGHLAVREHLLGGAFTIADLNVASLLYSAWFNKADLSRWPHVKAWLDRILTRPAALKARKLREA